MEQLTCQRDPREDRRESIVLLLPVLVADLLYVPPSVREPVVELSLRHACVEGEALLFGLGRVRVEGMIFDPSDENGGVPSQPLPHGERAARARSAVRARADCRHGVARGRRRLREVVARR